MIYLQLHQFFKKKIQLDVLHILMKQFSVAFFHSDIFNFINSREKKHNNNFSTDFNNFSIIQNSILSMGSLTLTSRSNHHDSIAIEPTLIQIFIFLTMSWEYRANQKIKHNPHSNPIAGDPIPAIPTHTKIFSKSIKSNRNQIVFIIFQINQKRVNTI